MEVLISYRTPGDLFNPGKRPPGHVLDPIIRSAVRTASSTLRELGALHRTEYLDGRDGPSGTDQFYGALIVLAGPAEECLPIPYGWEPEDRVPDGEKPRWKNLHACRAGHGADFDQGRTAAASVVEKWKEMGLVSTLRDEGEHARSPGREAPQKAGENRRAQERGAAA